MKPFQTTTSRQRVLTALSHREPDRIPIDFGASPVTSIAARTVIAMKKMMGLDTPTKMFVGEQLAWPEEAFLQHLRSDVRRIGPIPAQWKEWTFPDGTTGMIDSSLRLEVDERGGQRLLLDAGAVTYMPPDGWYFDILPQHQPLRGDITISDIEKVFASLPRHPGPDAIERIVADTTARAQTNEFALLGVFPTAIFECWFYRGFEQFLLDILEDPPLAEALMRIHGEYHIEFWRPVLEQIGPLLDVVFVSDDLGSQENLIVSPTTYRTMIKPLHKRLWGELKSLAPNARLFLHSCGAIEPLIGDFIECGADILNPIQFRAKGMDPAHLKRTYGRDITFWGGGVDTAGTLQRGTPAEIRDQVRRQIETLAPGGGFVFAAVHDIQPSTPPENVFAMLETLEEYGIPSSTAL